MKVLLVFEFFPEETQFYSLTPSADELETLGKANGVFVNTSYGTEEQQECAIRIDAAVSEDTEGFPDYVSDYRSIWVGNRILDTDLPNAGPFDKVFWTGIAL